MVDLSLLPLAAEEYHGAVEWYQQRSPRAASRFATAVERILSQIVAQPDRFGWYDDEFREAILRDYPFSVIYRVGATGAVLVVAVAHSSREPGYWIDRY